jgi:nucleotide-binding universal stress UspA family protein
MRDSVPPRTLRIVAPTAGPVAARESADYIIGLAKRIGAEVIALHIRSRQEATGEAAAGPNVFVDAGLDAGVTVITAVRSENVVDAIIETATLAQAAMIVMGASGGSVVDDWLSSDVMGRCDVPVVVIPHVVAGCGN